MHVNNGVELWVKNSLLFFSCYQNAEWWCHLESRIGFGEEGKFSLVTDPYNFISSKLIPELYLNSLHGRHAVIFIWYGWSVGPNFSEGIAIILFKLRREALTRGKFDNISQSCWDLFRFEKARLLNLLCFISRNSLILSQLYFVPPTYTQSVLYCSVIAVFCFKDHL